MRPELMRQIALVCALAVPLGLLHAFVAAEFCIAITDILFLAAMVRQRESAWARRPWFVLALAWWLWLVFCSLPIPAWGFGAAGWRMAFGQAFVVIRLIVFTAALQNWLLTAPAARRAAWALLALSVLWIGLESWQQYFTGHNLFGDPRWGDGSLTGPFRKPRAGVLYAHLLYTAMLPPALALLVRPGWLWRSAGMGLAILGVVTAVLIGQRMGVALVALGLFVAALYLAPLRRAAMAAAVIGGLVLAATPLISPPTHAKLVGETSRNLHHFARSPYGEIFTRATVMGLQSPLHGWGYNGYRDLCPEPRFDAGLPALGIAPTAVALYACNLHPQNYYIQAFADAGLPGLILFVLLVLVWMADLAKGLLARPDPLRVGLFISVLSFTWPLASTDEFPVLYMLGWLFFLLGLGLGRADIPAEMVLSKEAIHV